MRLKNRLAASFLAAGWATQIVLGEFVLTLKWSKASLSQVACFCDNLEAGISCTEGWEDGAIMAWSTDQSWRNSSPLQSLSDAKSFVTTSSSSCDFPADSWSLVFDGTFENVEGDRTVGFSLSSQSTTKIQVGGIAFDPLLHTAPLEKLTYLRSPKVTKAQLNPPTHLSRIQVPNNSSDIRFQRIGSGVHVYVVDTNVDSSHREFSDMFGDSGESRVLSDFDESFVADIAHSSEGMACASEHGTHVASLVSGVKSGMAKDSVVHPVAIHPGCGIGGRLSDLLRGLAWITRHRLATPEPRPPALATMSLVVEKSASASEAIEYAINGVLDLNVTIVAAAGNYAFDSCMFLPAGMERVITVGALASGGRKAWALSNSGRCVDIWAPGDEVTAASSTCPLCELSISGTSQAAPIVAGIIAQHAQNRLSVDPATTKRWLASVNISHHVKGLGRLAHIPSLVSQ